MGTQAPMEELALWKRMGTIYAEARRKGFRMEAGRQGSFEQAVHSCRDPSPAGH